MRSVQIKDTTMVQHSQIKANPNSYYLASKASALRLFMIMSDMTKYNKWFKKLKPLSYGSGRQASSVVLCGHVCKEYFHMAYIKKYPLLYQELDF